MEILIKIVQISLIWLLFFGFYHFFLRKETFFNINRYFLLAALGIGLTLPFALPYVKSLFEETITTLPTYTFTLNELNVGTEVSSSPDYGHWTLYLFMIYMIGVIYTLFRFLKSLHQIFELKNRGKVVDFQYYKLIKNEKVEAPFSFGKWLFLPQSHQNTSEDEAKIIEHELVHIQARHSFDIILVEILAIVFWFNPLLRFFQKALREVHEYEADNVVLRSISVKNYGQLLLKQAFPNIEINLVHNFHQAELKKRIKMMTKKKSAKRNLWRYGMITPLLLLVFVTFSAYKYTWNNVDVTNYKEMSLLADEDSIYQKVDKMPYLLDCEPDNTEELMRCTQFKLVEFISSSLNYPASAKENNTEGVVFISFVIDKDGEMRELKIARDIGDDCGAEALRVVSAFAESGRKWGAGQQNGEHVNVLMNLPIRFKLSE